MCSIDEKSGDLTCRGSKYTLLLIKKDPVCNWLAVLMWWI